MTVQTWTDRRFRRAHIKPSRRRRIAAARRRVAGGVGLLCTAGVVAFLLPGVLSTASFLRINTIAVEGNAHVSNGEILALMGQLRGQNILVADLEAHREQVMTFGWVKTATLRRVLPSTIEISVEERQPVGLARFNGRLYLIDDSGTLIDEHGPRFATETLPIIDGLSSGSGVAVDMTRARLASSLIASLASHPDLATHVSQINVEDPYDAVVLLSDGPTLIHLGNERFAERLQEYLDLLPALHEYVADIDSIDLRFEQRVFIRPADARARSVAHVAPGRARGTRIP